MMRTIAVDFDGCLCRNAWPEIGEANWGAIRALIEARRRGDKVILWTCRNGALLREAVDWCMERGLLFDAVNRNLDQHIRQYGDDTRKVYADEYWDDKAVYVAAEEGGGEA